MLLWLISIICAQCDGVFVMSIGSKGDGPGHFQNPRGLALTPDGLHLLVVDSGNERVVVLAASDGAWVRALTGPARTLREPFGVAVVPSTGHVLVSDVFLHTVVVFASVTNDTIVRRLGTGSFCVGCTSTPFQGDIFFCYFPHIVYSNRSRRGSSTVQ